MEPKVLTVTIAIDGSPQEEFALFFNRRADIPMERDILKANVAESIAWIINDYLYRLTGNPSNS